MTTAGPIRGLHGAWIIHLEPSARARDVERDVPALLHRWQQLGVDHYRDPEWDSPDRDAEAFALGVTSAHSSGDTSFPGTIYPLIELPRAQAGGIVAGSGDGLIEWAIPWISDPVRSDNLDKLWRSGKPQRHYSYSFHRGRRHLGRPRDTTVIAK